MLACCLWGMLGCVGSLVGKVHGRRGPHRGQQAGVEGCTWERLGLAPVGWLLDGLTLAKEILQLPMVSSRPTSLSCVRAVGKRGSEGRADEAIAANTCFFCGTCVMIPGAAAPSAMLSGDHSTAQAMAGAKRPRKGVRCCWFTLMISSASFSLMQLKVKVCDVYAVLRGLRRGQVNVRDRGLGHGTVQQHHV